MMSIPRMIIKRMPLTRISGIVMISIEKGGILRGNS